MTTPEYTLDDIADDTKRLHALIDTITDMAVDARPIDLTSEHYTKRLVSRLAALLCIARDLSKKTMDGVDALPPMEPRAPHGGAVGEPDRETRREENIYQKSRI